MDYFEKIEDYLNNSLTAQDRIAFELAMKADPVLANAVRDYPLAHTISKSLIELEVRQQLESMKQEKPSSMRTRLLSIRRIAAIFIIALGGILLYKLFSPQNISSDEIYASLYEKPSSNYTRSEVDTFSTLDSALYYFEEFRWDDAKILFNRLLRVDSLVVESQYYLGHMAMINKDFDSAKTIFEDIVSSRNPRFYEQSKYQLLIIHLMEKSRNLAKPIFQELQQKGYLSKDKEDRIKAYINQDD